MTESTSTQQTVSSAVYLDPSRPIAERVQDLLVAIDARRENRADAQPGPGDSTSEHPGLRLLE